MVSRPKRASAISYAERSPSSSVEGSGEDEIESEIEEDDGEEELEEEDGEGEEDAEGEEEDVEDQMDLDAEGEDEEEGTLSSVLTMMTDDSPNACSCQDSI
jgi:hypothetical protein